jgi:hypothetical protein
MVAQQRLSRHMGCDLVKKQKKYTNEEFLPNQRTRAKKILTMFLEMSL